MKGGPFGLGLPWRDLALGGLVVSGLFLKSGPISVRIVVRRNKTGTSRVGAISEAQKAQKTFFEKKLEIFEFFSFRKCRIVPKNVKGGPFGLS